MKPPIRRLSYFIATVEDVLQASEDALESGIGGIKAIRSLVRQVEDYLVDRSGKMAGNYPPSKTWESGPAEGIREAVELLQEWEKQQRSGR